jgi:hypothetical protein
VVAAPGDEDDARPVPGAKGKGPKLKADPALLKDAEGEAPWKAALRTIALDDPADDDSTDGTDETTPPKSPGKLRN